MFDFGNPEDTANMVRETCLAYGPGLAEIPLDEMTEDQLRSATTYAYMAYSDAALNDASDEVLSILKEDYDEAFKALAGASEDFRESLYDNRHQFLGARTRETIDYYRKLAAEA